MIFINAQNKKSTPIGEVDPMDTRLCMTDSEIYHLFKTRDGETEYNRYKIIAELNGLDHGNTAKIKAIVKRMREEETIRIKENKETLNTKFNTTSHKIITRKKKENKDVSK